MHIRVSINENIILLLQYIQYSECTWIHAPPSPPPPQPPGQQQITTAVVKAGMQKDVYCGFILTYMIPVYRYTITIYNVQYRIIY